MTKTITFTSNAPTLPEIMTKFHLGTDKIDRRLARLQIEEYAHAQQKTSTRKNQRVRQLAADILSTVGMKVDFKPSTSDETTNVYLDRQELVDTLRETMNIADELPEDFKVKEDDLVALIQTLSPLVTEPYGKWFGKHFGYEIDRNLEVTKDGPAPVAVGQWIVPTNPDDPELSGISVIGLVGVEGHDPDMYEISLVGKSLEMLENPDREFFPENRIVLSNLPLEDVTEMINRIITKSNNNANTALKAKENSDNE